MRRTKKKLLVIGIVTVLCMGLVACQPDTNVPETSDPISEEQQEVVESITFPYLIDDGKLEITSLFQYTGINPDCGNEEGTEIAAIQLKNVSESYLVEADIVMAMEDGTELHFVITDLPVGKSAIAFSIESDKLSMSNACTDIFVEAVFDDIQNADNILVSVDGMVIKLENISKQDLSEIDVYCHDVYEGKLFGGVTYKYDVDKIPAGDSATVIASDCILGMPDVVRVEVSN